MITEDECKQLFPAKEGVALLELEELAKRIVDRRYFKIVYKVGSPFIVDLEEKQFLNEMGRYFQLTWMQEFGLGIAFLPNMLRFRKIVYGELKKYGEIRTYIGKIRADINNGQADFLLIRDADDILIRVKGLQTWIQSHGVSF